VNKMSKSLGNAIGIHEPPLEMYGKIMSISDDMMWRYYELLTDVRTDQIEQMKRDVASGKTHPMALKKELARTIVADFHSAEAATKAGEDWAKQFQKDEVPEDVETVEIELEDVVVGNIEDAQLDALAQRTSWPECRIKLDKLVAHAGLADSATDAVRKMRQKAIKVNGEVKTDPVIFLPPENPAMLRVGKKMKQVRFMVNGESAASVRKNR
jgi:tyrosyl-tRNA synthetase